MTAGLAAPLRNLLRIAQREQRSSLTTNYVSSRSLSPTKSNPAIRWRKNCCNRCEQRGLAFEPGDILVVKHKIVSKAEGRFVDLATIKPSADSVAWAKKYNLDARVIELALRESRAVIRRKHGVLITETHHGFICANSGVDVSNVDGGRHALLLPADPDRSARKLHRELKKRTELAIPVLITDTFGRPWREGLVDFCIGIAGMKALRDDRGRRDPARLYLARQPRSRRRRTGLRRRPGLRQAQPHASVHHSRISLRARPGPCPRLASPGKVSDLFR